MNIKFLISSNLEYLNITTPKLIKSLNLAGVTDDKIAICINSTDKEESLQKSTGLTTHYFKTSMYEYVNFLGALLYDNDIFFLHDTCEVQPNFLNLLSHHIRDKNFDCVRLKQGYSNNIGLYKNHYIKKIKDRIEQINKDMSKQQAIRLEDSFFGGQVLYLQGDPIVFPPRDVYNQGQMRRVEVYESIGLIKYKSHWGQGIVGNQA